MKFRNDDYPKHDLADVVDSEHPQRLIETAGQRIRMHHRHDDGSSVELHEIGSKEFIKQSIQNSIESKLTDDTNWLQQENRQGNLAAAKIEYEKKSSDQPHQIYGAQSSAMPSHKQETFMMGCNCGAEWTVTGQSTKAPDPNNPAAVRIERYGSTGSGSAGYNVSSGGPGEYKAGGGASQDYKG